MSRFGWLKLIALFAVLVLATGRSFGQEPSGLEVATAMEEALVEVIAGADKSVVAVARVRKERPGETFKIEFPPDPFGRRFMPSGQPQPTDPDFIPNEFASGLFVDRRGLILTAYHVLGEYS